MVRSEDRVKYLQEHRCILRLVEAISSPEPIASYSSIHLSQHPMNKKNKKNKKQRELKIIKTTTTALKRKTFFFQIKSIKQST